MSKTGLRQSEHNMAVDFMKMVRLYECDYPELRYIAAWPNGGERSGKAASKIKAEGGRPGPLDYLCPIEKNNFNGLAIELKTQTGVVSEEQRDWIAMLKKNNWSVSVARSSQQAWDIVRWYFDLPETPTIGDLKRNNWKLCNEKQQY